MAKEMSKESSPQTKEKGQQVDPSPDRAQTPEAKDQDKSWRGSLASEDLRGDPSLSAFKDLDGLAKAYVDLKRRMGSAVNIPQVDAKAEEVDEFYRKLGRPDEPGGYGLGKIAVDGLGFDPDKSFLESAEKEFHKMGLTQKQAADNYQFFLGLYRSAKESQEKALAQSRQEGEDALKKKYGYAYQKNLELASAAIHHLGGDELVAELDGAMKGNSPAVIDAFVRVGKMLGESRFVGKPADEHPLTPQEAKEKIAGLQNDPEFVRQWMDASNPGHAAAIQKMTQLHRAAAASENQGAIKDVFIRSSY